MDKATFLATQSNLYDMVVGSSLQQPVPVTPVMLGKPVLLMTGPDHPHWVDDGTGKMVADADFWVFGRLGAKKGAPMGTWAGDSTTDMLIGMDHNVMHQSVVMPDGSVKTTAELGWVDGSGYRYDPALPASVNAAHYAAAGFPDPQHYTNAGAPIVGDANWVPGS